MTEIKSARELHTALTTRPEPHALTHAAWVWWAPGDCTRYRVTYVCARYHEGNAFIPLLAFEVAGHYVTLSRSRQLWTAASFLAEFGERYAGWWAGIRPVLAAFGWTSTRVDDLAYSPGDATEIGRLLAEV